MRSRARRPRGRPTGTAVASAVVACALGLAGCSPAAPAPPAEPPPVAGPALPVPDHVVIVVLENKDVDQVLSGSDAPYLQSLAARSADFTAAHAETHPSQPNYIALFSGDTQGITDDRCAQTLPAPSLGGRLIASGRTFTGYSEDLPEVGYTGCRAGGYARKHNPWVNFADVPASANRPLSDLPADYADLPTLAFVIPNLCHDMHDCDVATGDRWMRDRVEPYAEWAAGHNSLLIVTFDESASSSGGNGIVTLFTGPMVAPGRYDEPVDHYRMLRTIEALYGLDPLGRSAGVDPISDVWTATH
jgi:phosphatidylinositol-3-phosphatase